MRRCSGCNYDLCGRCGASHVNGQAHDPVGVGGGSGAEAPAEQSADAQRAARLARFG